MKLKIEIRMDNAAFEPFNGTESARILRELADNIDGGQLMLMGDELQLRDVNGNRVGEAKVSR